jgi:hypothetical protein
MDELLRLAETVEFHGPRGSITYPRFGPRDP